MNAAHSTGSGQAPTFVRWHIVALLMGLCLVSHLNRAAMSVAGTDRIMGQYQIDPVQMGAIYTAFLVVYSICMIPGGVLIDRAGPRRALMIVGFGSAVFGALTGLTGWLFTTGPALLLALTLVRGTMGMVSAPLHPSCARAVGNWFPFAHRVRANGFVTAAAIAGIALTYPGFGMLVRHFDWPVAFMICAGLTAALTLIWSVYAADSPRQHPGVNAAEQELIAGKDTNGNVAATQKTESGVDWTGLLTNRSLLLLTLSYAAVGYFQYLFVYWTDFYLKNVLHVDPTQSKYFASAPQVALALGMPLGGLLSEALARAWGVRRGRAAVAGGGMAISAFMVVLGLLAKDPTTIIVWLSFAHAAIGMSEGPTWATAVDIGRAKGGTAAAICNTGGNVGGLLAPVFTPWIGSHFGWPWAIAAGGAVCLLGAVCWVWIDTPRKHEHEST